ncbi:hypothetical protein Taro_030214 [Colocasia esculenta]|uniref:Uncharacterized protein n=1 Tax=Colocasia esculenta TaxID=4460 RepID=A0A843VFS7_COLES|nr:hypothetical protein [Colocasia esculenta]
MFPVRRPVLGRVVAVQGQYLQRSIVYFLLLYLGVCPRLLYTFTVLMEYGYVNCEKLYMKCGVFIYVYTDCGLVSLARLRPVRGRRTRIKCVIGLSGLAEAFRHTSRIAFEASAPMYNFNFEQKM